MKAIHQLSTFQNILKQYSQNEPLHRFLATYYRQNKQMGSKDRRTASRLIYNYFRLGKALVNEPIEERLIVAEFLCNTETNDFIAHFKPNWNQLVPLPLKEKINLVKAEYPDFNLADVFPFQNYISDKVDQEAFYQSFFIQPDLFIRMQRGQDNRIINQLKVADIKFTQVGPQTLAFTNSTNLDQVLTDKGIYEVQDLSSQKACTYFKPQKWDKWWDCCAASGGKSLYLHDEEPTVKLLVSDNRASILENLKERFSLARITNYQRKVLDLTLNQALFLHDYEFDGIILDAPCSGSGTWGRTPEMITQTEEYKIKFYTELQRKIALNVVKYLKVGKPLIYITCSVFKAENEEQVEWLCKQFNLVVESQELITGYNYKADTLFVARLIK
ncbi:RsmB/NOP family class I SAM-dependent RNA methyltransferase [Pedobacter alpinus]|uniref:RsmB/NOP family class I SAM-dependent RNA methyltransferase n=1 Tax=Pedobacter alpinus TaxID=1590643 RepID=A0ABW5TWJ1_9SPHI